MAVVPQLTMVFGILVIALPITVVGSNFAQVYEKQQLYGNRDEDSSDDSDDEEER